LASHRRAAGADGEGHVRRCRDPHGDLDLRQLLDPRDDRRRRRRDDVDAEPLRRHQPAPRLRRRERDRPRDLRALARRGHLLPPLAPEGASPMTAVATGRRTTIAGLTGRLVLIVLGCVIILGPLASLVIWSFAEEWFWPNHWPTQWG